MNPTSLPKLFKPPEPFKTSKHQHFSEPKLVEQNYIETLIPIFGVFLLFFWYLRGLNSSGRLVGFISTYPGQHVVMADIVAKTHLPKPFRNAIVPNLREGV